MAGVWWGRDEDSVRRRSAPAHMVATRRALLVLFVIAAARGEPLPPRRIHVRTRVGCSPHVELSLQPSPAADVWVRPDDDIGLPRNSVFLCDGSAIDHLPHGGWKTVPGTGLVAWLGLAVDARFADWLICCLASPRVPHKIRGNA